MKTATRAMRVSTKELREAAPLGLCGLVLVAALSLGAPGSWPAYWAFCSVAIALGATSVGQEYRYRTLATLLTQPRGRTMILAPKVVVLAAFLGLLTLATRLPIDAWVLIPLTCALLLAPWLTMVCRSELAGLVFAAAVPAVLVVGGQTAALLVYGLESGRQRDTVLVWRVVIAGMGLAGACGAVGTVLTFRRLQAIDSDWADVHLPDWLRRGARPVRARRLNRYWALVRKETRLQGLAFGVAALFVLAWVGVSLSAPGIAVRIDLDTLRAGLASFYVGTVPLLIGASAIAEERRLNTLVSQMLFPVAAWKQFAVKVLVSIALTELLVRGVPVALMWVTPGIAPRWFRVPLGRWQLDLPVIALAVFGLYVSSFTASALRALLASLAGLVAAVTAFSLMLWPGQVLALVSFRLPPDLQGAYFVSARWSLRWLPWGLGAILCAILLRLALSNHRTASLTRRAIQRQVAMVFLCVMVAALILTTISSTFEISWFEMRHHRLPTISEIQGRVIVR